MQTAASAATMHAAPASLRAELLTRAVTLRSDILLQCVWRGAGKLFSAVKVEFCGSGGFTVRKKNRAREARFLSGHLNHD